MFLRSGENDAGRRLDRILRKALPDIPLSALHRWIRSGKILVNGKKASLSDRIAAGSDIEVPLSAPMPPQAPTAPLPVTAPTSGAGSLLLKADIIAETRQLLVLNKKAGVPVHGGPRCGDNLESAVRSYLAGKTSDSLSFKSGPLHRLDRGTSGLIVFSVSLDGARIFSELLRRRRLKKSYLAILCGADLREESWEDTLVREDHSRRAITAVRPLLCAEDHSKTLVYLEIGTGRTHQIRAQAAMHGHPLWGDGKYGGGQGKTRFFLHAWRLRFLSPPENSGLEALDTQLEAEIPAAFRAAIEKIFHQSIPETPLL